MLSKVQHKWTFNKVQRCSYNVVQLTKITKVPVMKVFFVTLILDNCINLLRDPCFIFYWTLTFWLNKKVSVIVDSFFIFPHLGTKIMRLALVHKVRSLWWFTIRFSSFLNIKYAMVCSECSALLRRTSHWSKQHVGLTWPNITVCSVVCSKDKWVGSLFNVARW